MSIAHNLDRSPDAGFTRSFDTESARRQLQLSLVLVLILAVATLMLSIMIRFDTPTSASLSPVKPIETHYAGDKPVRG
ncbi:MAG: hypothetical protein QOF41_2969 [Methylobacteriaceae bacterium]|jgi:hypothetical protein|nr:hypothetical protein [Methylobacteriaceae bacterium]